MLNKIKTWLRETKNKVLAFLGVVTITTAAIFMVGDIPPEQPLINVTGQQVYFHVFEDGIGEKLYVETTETGYKALGLKGAGAPSIPDGYTWDYSYSAMKPLQDNEYWLDNYELVLKLPNKKVRTFGIGKHNISFDGKLDVDSAELKIIDDVLQTFSPIASP